MHTFCITHQPVFGGYTLFCFIFGSFPSPPFILADLPHTVVGPCDPHVSYRHCIVWRTRPSVPRYIKARSVHLTTTSECKAQMTRYVHIAHKVCFSHTNSSRSGRGDILSARCVVTLTGQTQLTGGYVEYVAAVHMVYSQRADKGLGPAQLSHIARSKI